MAATLTAQLVQVCDRCIARAQVCAKMPSGGELFFCSHHSDEHGTRLAEQGATLTRLTEGQA